MKVWRLVLLFGLCVVWMTAGSTMALAQYLASPSCGGSYVTGGGGTWGSILKMRCQSISGVEGTFRVKKKDGSSFGAGTAYLKVGAPNGVTHTVKDVSAGTPFIDLEDVFSDVSASTYPKNFYIRFESSVGSGGHAWVGPVRVVLHSVEGDGRIDSPSFSERGAFTAQGTASDGDGLERVTLVATQGSLRRLYRTYLDISPPYFTSKNWSKTIDPESGGFQDGFITFGLWVKDQYGDDNGAAVDVRTVDWKKPAASSGSIDSPTSSRTGSFIAEGHARDADGIHAITVVLSQGSRRQDFRVYTDNSAPYTSFRNWDGEIDPASAGFVTGNISLALWVKDQYGETNDAAVDVQTIHWTAHQDSPPEFLTSGTVSPSTGDIGDSFTFEVQARDLDDDDIAMSVRVTDPSGGRSGWISMGWAGGSTPTGAWFRESLTLDEPGTYSFRFRAAAGGATEYSSTRNGPTVNANVVVQLPGSEFHFLDDLPVSWTGFPPSTSSVKVSIKRDIPDGEITPADYRVLSPGSPESPGGATFTVPTDIHTDTDWRVWIKDVANETLLGKSDRISFVGFRAPSLYSPADGTGGYSTRQQDFDWEDLPGADAYRIVVSEELNFGGFNEETDSCDDTCRTAKVFTARADGFSGLKPDHEYFWRVRAANTFAGGRWPSQPNRFTTLDLSSWAEEALDFLQQAGIVLDSGTVRGTKPVNRAELAHMLHLGLSSEPSRADLDFEAWAGGVPTSTFDDVGDPGDSWFSAAVTYLAHLSFAGDGSRTTVFNRTPNLFRPSDEIDRGAVLKALLEAWDIQPRTTPPSTEYADVPFATHPYAGYIYKARDLGILNGSQSHYRPDEDANREDVFVMLYRTLSAVGNLNGNPPPKPQIVSGDFDPFLPVGTEPVISGISPLIARPSSSARFTVSGEFLPEGMTFELAECTDVTELLEGTFTARTFQCTTGASQGSKAGRILYPTASGTGEHPFTVEISEHDCVFEDVDPDKWYHEPIQYLCARGILEGEGGGDHIKPGAKINRAALAKIAFLGADVPPVADAFPSPFHDLLHVDASNAWYFTYAKNLSYLQFDDCTTPFDRDRFHFLPAGYISRAHVLKVLLEAWNLPLQEGPSPFTDVDPNHEAFRYIYTAALHGIVDGSRSEFHPNKNAVRVEAFQMLYNLLTHPTIEKPTIDAGDFFVPLNFTYKNANRSLSLVDGSFRHYEQRGLHIPGFHLPLEFRHSYSSGLTELPGELFPLRPLGHGWSHNYNAYVVSLPGDAGSPDDDRLAVVWPGGAVHVYREDVSGPVALTEGVYDELSRTSPSAFTIKTKGQILYTFERPVGASETFPAVLTALEDRNGNRLSFEYEPGATGVLGEPSGRYRLRTATGTAGRQLEFLYHPGTDLVQEVRDLAGNRNLTFGYSAVPEAEADLVSFTNARGNTTQYAYDHPCGGDHLLTRVTLPKGNVIENRYDPSRKLESSTRSDDPGAAVGLDFVYDFSGGSERYVRTALTSPGGHLYLLDGNSKGRVTGIQTPEGRSTTFEYEDPNHPTLPTKVFREDGVVVRYEYDARGNTSLVSLPFGVSHHFTYDNLNNLIRYEDPRDKVYTYEYPDGNLRAMESPLGGRLEIERDDRGMVTRVTNAAGEPVAYDYNGFGDLKEAARPLEIVRSFTYDAVSRARTVTDPKGRVTQWSYDANDQVTEVRDPLDHLTKYTYDKNDLLDFVTNAEDAVTDLDYDDRDLLKSQSFGGQSELFTYRLDGRRKTWTRPNGDVFTYGYDRDGRLEDDGYAAYGYHPTTHRLETVTHKGNGSQLVFTHDGLGRVSQVTYGGQSVVYGYDTASQVTSLTYPGNKIVTYTYDDDGRMKTVTDWNQRTVTYDYRPDGTVEAVRYPNGIVTRYGYDGAGRMNLVTTADASGSVLHEKSVTLDKAGNPVGEQLFGSLVTQPTPDAGQVSYRYDTANRIEEAGSTAFTHDNNGNVLQKGSVGYTYDSLDHLLTYSGDVSLSFTYDGLGNRRTRTENGVTTRYVLDVLGAARVLLETTAAGEPKNYYVYGLGLLARIGTDDQARYYVYDERGSTLALVDQGGVVTHRYAYDAFGDVLLAEEEDFNPFRYVGRFGVMYEAEDLQFMRARYYDPDLGRFLSQDPIWSTNLYPYVGNNPLRFIDPLGTEKIDWDNWDELIKEKLAVTRETFNRKIDLVTDWYELKKHHYSKANPHPKMGSYEGHIEQLEGKQRRLQKLDRAIEKKAENQLKKHGAKKTVGALGKKALPIVGVGFFFYDWNQGGLGYATNELLWPASEVWRDDGIWR